MQRLSSSSRSLARVKKMTKRECGHQPSARLQYILKVAALQRLPLPPLPSSPASSPQSPSLASPPTHLRPPATICFASGYRRWRSGCYRTLPTPWLCMTNSTRGSRCSRASPRAMMRSCSPCFVSTRRSAPRTYTDTHIHTNPKQHQRIRTSCLLA